MYETIYEIPRIRPVTLVTFFSHVIYQGLDLADVVIVITAIFLT